jgi:uncharacterized protein YceK
MARAAGVAVLAVVALSGCGTVYDTCRMSPWGQTFRVYGGVRADAESAGECAERAFGDRPDARLLDLTRAALNVADMPLSAAADTLLLPQTLPRARRLAGETPPEPGCSPTALPLAASPSGPPAPAAEKQE